MVKCGSSALLGAALALGLAGAAEAATAHNSQAGSWGSTKNNCAPTPYFQEGGCASDFIADVLQPTVAEPPMPRYRVRRLTAPTGPVPPPAD